MPTEEKNHRSYVEEAFFQYHYLFLRRLFLFDMDPFLNEVYLKRLFKKIMRLIDLGAARGMRDISGDAQAEAGRCLRELLSGMSTICSWINASISPSGRFFSPGDQVGSGSFKIPEEVVPREMVLGLKRLVQDNPGAIRGVWISCCDGLSLKYRIWVMVEPALEENRLSDFFSWMRSFSNILYKEKVFCDRYLEPSTKFPIFATADMIKYSYCVYWPWEYFYAQEGTRFICGRGCLDDLKPPLADDFSYWVKHQAVTYFTIFKSLVASDDVSLARELLYRAVCFGLFLKEGIMAFSKDQLLETARRIDRSLYEQAGKIEGLNSMEDTFTLASTVLKESIMPYV